MYFSGDDYWFTFKFAEIVSIQFFKQHISLSVC